MSTFYEDGKIRKEIEYREAKPYGTWKYYHPNGETSVEEPYEDGVITGIRKTYNEEGKLVLEEEYKKQVSKSGKARSSKYGLEKRYENGKNVNLPESIIDALPYLQHPFPVPYLYLSLPESFP